MTLNANTVSELLDAATPGPWHVAMLDLHRDTGVIDNEHAQANQRLAALAPELAADWLRLHDALSAWIEDERAAETVIYNAYGLMNITTTHTPVINRINSILNGETNA